MTGHISIIAATLEEAEIVKVIPGMVSGLRGLTYHGKEISVIVTGVGTVATAWAMTRMLSSGIKPDLAINIGIAGSFRDNITIGKVVLPVSDCFADAGIETAGGFFTLHEAGLQDGDAFPFRNGRLIAESELIGKAAGIFPSVSAITVNTPSGTENQIAVRTEKYNSDIESMEGAAFFYVSLMEKVNFIALRAVSNMVEVRNKDKWDIPLALKNLAAGLEEILILTD